MRANLNYLYKKFVEFNETIFKSSLPPIEIKISRGGKVLGCLHKKTSRLGLRTSYSMTFTNRYDMPEQMLEDILIHEMIHYRVALDGIADTSMHGDCFKAIMNQINREHGRNISLRVELPKQVLESDNMSVRNYIITCRMKGYDSRLFMRCALTRIFDIYRELQNIRRVSDIRFYSSTSAVFNRYSNSRSVKLYKMTDEVKEVLEMSPELEMRGNNLCAI